MTVQPAKKLLKTNGSFRLVKVHFLMLYKNQTNNRSFNLTSCKIERYSLKVIFFRFCGVKVISQAIPFPTVQLVSQYSPPISNKVKMNLPAGWK